MGFWEFIYKTLCDSKMPTPPMYGWIHCTFIGFFILLAIVLILIDKKKSNKHRIILLVIWVAFLIVEVLKEVKNSAVFENGVYFGRYDFFEFPLVVCSVPFYVLPAIIFIKNEKIRTMFESFGCWVFLLGGLIGFLIPSYNLSNAENISVYTVFQTLFHHGLMIVTSVYMAFHYKNKFSLKFNLSAIPVMAGFMIVGASLCAIINPTNLPGHDRFHGFLMSWTVIPNMPIMSDVWKAVPYPVYLIIYILGFILVMFILYALYSLILLHKINLNVKELTLVKFIKKQKEIRRIKNDKI